MSRRGLFGRVWSLLCWPILIGFAALALLQGYYALSIATLNFYNPETTAFMDAERDRLSKGKKTEAKLRHQWVSYPSISVSAKRAVIAAEDSTFAYHDGVDWEAIEKAARENLRKGTVKRGGSTITMQLAKNLYLSSERSYIRKAQEFVLASMLELLVDKRRILEIYLNVAEWGIGVFGIEAAARHYYGVSAAELDDAQAAWLASILPAPRRYDRNRESEWIQEKALVIQERMPKVSLPK